MTLEWWSFGNGFIMAWAMVDVYWWNILGSLIRRTYYCDILCGNDRPWEVGPEILIFMKSYIWGVPSFFFPARTLYLMKGLDFEEVNLQTKQTMTYFPLNRGQLHEFSFVILLYWELYAQFNLTYSCHLNGNISWEIRSNCTLLHDLLHL